MDENKNVIKINTLLENTLIRNVSFKIKHRLNSEI